MALVLQVGIMARPIWLPRPSTWTIAYEGDRAHISHAAPGVRWYRARTMTMDDRLGIEWPGRVVSRRGGTIVAIDPEAYGRLASAYTPERDVGAPQPLAALPEFLEIRTPIVASAIRERADLEIVEAGWPRRAGYAVRVNIHWDRSVWMAGDRSLLRDAGGLDLPLGEHHGHAIYVRPWPLVLNTLTLAAPPLLAWWLALSVRSRVRRRRGLCARCGYDAGGLGRCPECGAPRRGAAGGCATR